MGENFLSSVGRQPGNFAAAKWQLLVFGCAVLVVLAVGGGFYRFQERELHGRAVAELQAIADMKVKQIAAWRQALVEDAFLLMENPFLMEELCKRLEDRSMESGEEIQAAFRSLKQYRRYYDVLVVDREGRVWLSLNSRGTASIHPKIGQTLQEAWAARSPVLTDLQEGPGNLPPHLDVVAPVLKRNSPAPELVGAVVLRMDAGDFLYPLIQSWPLPSAGAETLLVRREGDEVLFLNELRHQTGVALKLKIPLSRTDVPAVMAVSGRTGVVEGLDYRGVPVLAVLMAVPDSPWFMVAKVDHDEVFVFWHFAAGLILTLMAMVVLALAAFLGMIVQRNKKAHYRAMVQAQASLVQSEERHRTTLMSVGDGVMVTDKAGRVTMLNAVAEQLTGWSGAEAQGRPITEVFRIINEESRETVENPVHKVLREGTVVGLANHTLLIARNGFERPIADSGAPIRTEDGQVIGVVLVFRDQSAERAAEAALRAGEERYRLLFNAMLEGFAHHELICDDHGRPVDYRFLQVNPAFERMTGLAARDIIGRTVREVLPKTESHWIETYGQVALTGKPVQFENYSREIERHFRVSAFCPTPGQFAVSFEDITAEKQADAEREIMIDLLGLMNSRNDIQALIRDVTALMQSFSGCEAVGVRLQDGDDFPYFETRGFPAEFVALEFSLCIRDREGKILRDEAGKPLLECMCGNIIRGRFNPALPFFTKNGSFWTNSTSELLSSTGDADRLAPTRNRCNSAGYESVALVPLRFADETFGLMQFNDKRRNRFSKERMELLERLADNLAIGLAQRRTALELMESEQHFRTLSDSGQALVWASGTDKKCNYFNRPWLEFTGRSLADELGDGWTAGVHPEDLAGCLHTYSTAFDRRDFFSMTYRLRRHDGEYRWIQDNGTPRYDSTGKFIGYIGHCLDITALKQAEAEKERLLDQLLQSQKMEAVGRLAGGVAHDFNNMLSIILGYGEMLLDARELSSLQHENLKEMLEAAGRAKNLTRQLLAFGRKQMLEMKIVDINQVVRGIEKLLRRTIGEDIELKVDLRAAELHVRADVSQLEQILMNLAINARDAMPDGGTLTLETAVATLDEVLVDQKPGAAAGTYALIAVSDQGAGMDAETVSHIFEPFFTTKEVGKGTGLGLSMVYGIVKQHGGNIYVYSEPGQGAVFKIYLPLAEGAALRMDETPVQTATKTPEAAATVLVVEDEPAVRRLTCVMLKKKGYHILEAGHPRAAIELARDYRDPIHLLLTDVVMPDMKAKELAGRIQALHPETRVLYMSGYTENVIVRQGVLDKGVQLIQKPFTAAGLEEKIKKAIMN